MACSVMFIITARWNVLTAYCKELLTPSLHLTAEAYRLPPQPAAYYCPCIGKRRISVFIFYSRVSQIFPKYPMYPTPTPRAWARDPFPGPGKGGGVLGVGSVEYMKYLGCPGIKATLCDNRPFRISHFRRGSIDQFIMWFSHFVSQI